MHMQIILSSEIILHFPGRDITGKSIEDIVYEAQRKVILEMADRESCVIIGRNADYILKDRDDVLNVFIHGNMPEKTQRIMGLYNVEEKEAVKMIADTDKRRMTNYNFYTDQKWIRVNDNSYIPSMDPTKIYIDIYNGRVSKLTDSEIECMNCFCRCLINFSEHFVQIFCSFFFSQLF